MVLAIFFLTMHFLTIMYNFKTWILILIACVVLERFCHKQTRGFALHKILSSPSSGIEEFPLCEKEYEEMNRLFEKPFTFLSSGGQCYAFLSHDKTRVLKFFKQHHLRFYRFLNQLYLPHILEPLRAKQLRKMQHYSPLFLESCKIAWRDFKEQSGLIYLHLNQTHHFQRKVILIDPLGIKHSIDLDTTEFALQTRAELCYPKFRQLLKEGDISGAKECIDSLISLICERQRQEIKDRDPHIRKNIGFVGNRAIEIDLGSFTKGKPTTFCDEWNKTTRHFHTWLTKHNKELSLYLNQRLETVYEKL
jgi:hypothetical protein